MRPWSLLAGQLEEERLSNASSRPKSRKARGKSLRQEGNVSRKNPRGCPFQGSRAKPGPGGIPPGPEVFSDTQGSVSRLHGNELPLSSLQPRLLARSSSPASWMIVSRLQVESAALTSPMTSGSVIG